MISTGSFSATITNSGATEICRFAVNGRRIGAEVLVATNTLAAFEIHAQFHPNGAFISLFSTSGHYTSPSGVLVGASGDLTGQVAGSGFFLMDVDGISQLLIKANSASAGGSTVTIKYKVSP